MSRLPEQRRSDDALERPGRGEHRHVPAKSHAMLTGRNAVRAPQTVQERWGCRNSRRDIPGDRDPPSGREAVRHPDSSPLPSVSSARRRAMIRSPGPPDGVSTRRSRSHHAPIWPALPERGMSRVVLPRAGLVRLSLPAVRAIHIPFLPIHGMSRASMKRGRRNLRRRHGGRPVPRGPSSSVLLQPMTGILTRRMLQAMPPRAIGTRRNGMIGRMSRRRGAPAGRGRPAALPPGLG